MRAFAPFLLAALAAGSSANAAESAASYHASWAGLPAADIRLGFREDGTSVETEILIASKGIPRWITKFRADAEGDARIAPGGAAVPSRYRALYDLRKRLGSRIDLRYVEHDGASIAERDADDTTRKPPLAEQFRRNVVDPLSALMVIRRALEAHPGEKREFVVPVFDGARRFDVVTDVVEWNAEDRLVRVKLNLRPIAGFKGESSDDQDPDDAPRPVDVAFAEDASLLPVSLRVSIAYLPLVVRLDHRCASFAACDDDAH